MKRQVDSVLVESDEIIYSTCFAERHPEQRTDKRQSISDVRESGCLTANMRILRADMGAEVTFGELMRTGERPLVWSLDERKRMIARPMTNVFYSGRREVFRLRLASGPGGGGDGEPSVHDACPLGSVGRVDDWRSPCGTARGSGARQYGAYGQIRSHSEHDADMVILCTRGSGSIASNTSFEVISRRWSCFADQFGRISATTRQYSLAIWAARGFDRGDPLRSSSKPVQDVATKCGGDVGESALPVEFDRVGAHTTETI